MAKQVRRLHQKQRHSKNRLKINQGMHISIDIH